MLVETEHSFVRVMFDIVAQNLDEGMRRIGQEMDLRDIPDDDRRGLVGTIIDPSAHYGESFIKYGIRWGYDNRLGPGIAVGWHPDAIIPPAIVLRPEAVIYCGIGIARGDQRTWVVQR